MRKQQFITVHDENLSIAKFLGIIAAIICTFYSVRGLFMGETFAKGFIESWMSGFGVVALLFVLLIALIFFFDWLLYLCVRKVVIMKGSKHNGIIASEIEKKHTNRGAVRRNWKYIIELEDYSTYLSTAYTSQIPLRRKCTVYILKSICIITDFDV